MLVCPRTLPEPGPCQLREQPTLPGTASPARPEGRWPVGEDQVSSLHRTELGSPRSSPGHPHLSLSASLSCREGGPERTHPACSLGSRSPSADSAGRSGRSLCIAWGPVTTQTRGCTPSPQRSTLAQRPAPGASPPLAPRAQVCRIQTRTPSSSLGLPLPALCITVFHCFNFLCDGVLLLFQDSKGGLQNTCYKEGLGSG